MPKQSSVYFTTTFRPPWMYRPFLAGRSWCFMSSMLYHESGDLLFDNSPLTISFMPVASSKKSIAKPCDGRVGFAAGDAVGQLEVGTKGKKLHHVGGIIELVACAEVELRAVALGIEEDGIVASLEGDDVRHHGMHVALDEDFVEGGLDDVLSLRPFDDVRHAVLELCDGFVEGEREDAVGQRSLLQRACRGACQGVVSAGAKLPVEGQADGVPVAVFIERTAIEEDADPLIVPALDVRFVALIIKECHVVCRIIGIAVHADAGALIDVLHFVVEELYRELLAYPVLSVQIQVERSGVIAADGQAFVAEALQSVEVSFLFRRADERGQGFATIEHIVGHIVKRAAHGEFLQAATTAEGAGALVHADVVDVVSNADFGETVKASKGSGHGARRRGSCREPSPARRLRHRGCCTSPVSRTIPLHFHADGT